MAAVTPPEKITPLELVDKKKYSEENTPEVAEDGLPSTLPLRNSGGRPNKIALRQI